MGSFFAEDLEFTKLLQGSAEVDLPIVCLELARDAYPGLDFQESLNEMQRLSLRVRNRLRFAPQNDAELAAKLEDLSELFHIEEGFFGNLEDYYDPRNSYLNEVLCRRRGIPISLAMIFHHLARQVGLNVFPVGTPGHLMLGIRFSNETRYLDPFRCSELLTREECEEKIRPIIGGNETLPDEAFYPLPPRAMVGRVLRNLKASHCLANHWSQALLVQRRLAILLPHQEMEKRDLGLVLLRNDQPREALDLLIPYVKKCDPSQASEILPYIQSARRMLSERN